MTKKTLLLVSPFPNDRELYPHLKYLIDELSIHYEIDYFHGYIRGIENELEIIIHQLLTNPLRISSYKPFFFTIKNLIQLYQKSHQEKYDVVLCIDNFLYVMTSLIFPEKAILWSHDFVGYDKKNYGLIFQKLMVKLTRKALERNNRLIIQDKERLELFLETIQYNGTEVSIFFLPVSLIPAKPPNKISYFDSKLPLLMQIGYIASWRSSDELIKCYQQNFDKFNLSLHGFISDEIGRLLDEVEVLPLICSQRVLADQMPQLIHLSDIGFISYIIGDLNHFYIKNASGQLVEFLRCGKPVIVHGETDLPRYVEENQIGVSIKSFDELVPAIHQIRHNYREYSCNCIKIFEESYNLKEYLEKLMLYI